MRVLSIELENVRQFVHKRLDFGPGVNLLVGENGAGKSTVLRSLLTVLGHAGNFKGSDRLSDEDIRHRAHEFRVRVECEEGDAIISAEIMRRWRRNTKRKGSISKSPILWFGATESAARTLQGQKVRYRRYDKNDKRWDRDDILFREEFLFHEEFMDPPDEEKQPEFGRSDIVRRFVGRVLSSFSPKFERFVWRFLPYDCLVQTPEDFLPDPAKASAFRREVGAEMMRFLDYDYPGRRYRGWGSMRTAAYNADGQPVDGKKRLRSMPEFRDILETVAKRLNVEKPLAGVIIQIKLAPRIAVLSRDGPFLLSQLSDGEKRIFSMIVDIARQLSLTQGGWREIETTSGLVVIDEIDCHLHPKWQRMIVKALEDLFPACQFIATTHSPFIVQAVEAHQLHSLGRETLPDFTDRGIEEIAFKVMRIESPEVSPRYFEMLDVAKEYYELLEQSKSVADTDREALRIRLRSLSGRYARNPAFQAYLDMKGEGILGADM